MRNSGVDRGLSKVIGVALLVVIVAILAVITAASMTSLSSTALDSSAVHGTGAYEFDLAGENSPVLRITPESVQTRDSTYHIQVNGEDVYEQWDGSSELEIQCLSPWDEVTIYTSKGSTTNLVTEETVGKFLACPDKIGDGRFEHAYFNGDKVDVKATYDLPLAINPDGPGPDDDNGGNVHHDEIGEIPFSNPWHYSKLYNDDDGTIEGYQKPVWLFILVDNVHWTNAPSGNGHLNWTDDVPTGMAEPGAGNYDLVNGDSEIDARPSAGSGEPTNDIYVVFKPECDTGPGDESKLKIIYVDAGYENRILMDGQVVVDDTSDLPQRQPIDEEFDAPGIPC